MLGAVAISPMECATAYGQVQKPATAPTSDGVVYGPYVPYIPPSKRQAVAPQAAQPCTSPTKKPTGQSQPGTSGVDGTNGTTVVNGIVYGPYVPYVPSASYAPPAATDVQRGTTPPLQVAKPEVPDVLPTAKVSPGVDSVPAATHPGATSAQAAAAARRHARAAPTTGYSKPPVEDYATPPPEPAPRTVPPLQAPPVQVPPQGRLAPVYVKPGAQLALALSSSSTRPTTGAGRATTLCSLARS